MMLLSAQVKSTKLVINTVTGFLQPPIHVKQIEDISDVVVSQLLWIHSVKDVS